MRFLFKQNLVECVITGIEKVKKHYPEYAYLFIDKFTTQDIIDKAGYSDEVIEMNNYNSMSQLQFDRFNECTNVYNVINNVIIDKIKQQNLIKIQSFITDLLNQ